MNILAFDTSSTACTVALSHKDKVHFRHQVAPMQQGTLLLPLIDELLQESGLTLADLDAIAFGAGPGSFTGIRIASSTAQGLAYAANLPLIRISSLAVIAQAAKLEHGGNTFLIAVDARVGQIYFAKYTVNSSGYVELNGREQLCKPQQVQIQNIANDWHAAGNGWGIYKEELAAILQNLPNIHTEQLPQATALLELAKEAAIKNEKLAPIAGLPIYLS